MHKSDPVVMEKPYRQYRDYKQADKEQQIDAVYTMRRLNSLLFSTVAFNNL